VFARKVTARLQLNAITEFAHLMECEILPWLRTQEGFQDLITLVAPDGSEVTAISFWDHEGNAQAFNSIGYPAALQILGRLLDGVPYVKTYEVVSSTFRGSARTRPPVAETVVAETDSAPRGYLSYETSA
jgi:hypothetical protein